MINVGDLVYCRDVVDLKFTRPHEVIAVFNSPYVTPPNYLILVDKDEFSGSFEIITPVARTYNIDSIHIGKHGLWINELSVIRSAVKPQAEAIKKNSEAIKYIKDCTPNTNGMTCKRCHTYNPYAEANLGNEYLCYNCRK